MQNKRLLFLSVATLALGIVVSAFSCKGNEALRPHFGQTELSVVRKDGTRVLFKTEIAETREEQAYGLMFVRSLPENRAMIFPMRPPRMVSFWMKNTYIPLDMLFVRPNGEILQIEANVKPLDETLVHSRDPVAAVVELRGGMAEKLGLKIGDRIESSALKQQ